MPDPARRDAITHFSVRTLSMPFKLKLSGDLGQLLLAYLSTPRSKGFEVGRTMVDHDAKALFKAGEKRLGTDEKTFRAIFSGRSRAHIRADRSLREKESLILERLRIDMPLLLPHGFVPVSLSHSCRSTAGKCVQKFNTISEILAHWTI